MRPLANAARLKKTRVQQRGVFVIGGSDILARKDAVKEVEANKYVERRVLNAGPPSTQLCGSCKKTGHNARICQEDV